MKHVVLSIVPVCFKISEPDKVTQAVNGDMSNPVAASPIHTGFRELDSGPPVSLVVSSGHPRSILLEKALRHMSSKALAAKGLRESSKILESEVRHLREKERQAIAERQRAESRLAQANADAARANAELFDVTEILQAKTSEVAKLRETECELAGKLYLAEQKIHDLWISVGCLLGIAAIIAVGVLAG